MMCPCETRLRPQNCGSLLWMLLGHLLAFSKKKIVLKLVVYFTF